MAPLEGRLEAQTDLLLDSLTEARAFPENWREVGDFDYLYHRDRLLVRDRDVDRVRAVLQALLAVPDRSDDAAEGYERPQVQILDRPVVDGVARLDYSRTGLAPPTVPQVLAELDVRVGVGKVRPDHVLYDCGHSCPATEPEEVPVGTVDPFPAPFTDDCCCGPTARAGHGREVHVAIVDRGFLAGADAEHSWLAGVTGDVEDPLDGTGQYIRQYAGHGTFVAGCVRCTAPQACVSVKGADLQAGADFESNLVPKLSEALAGSPDIIVFTFATQTRLELSLLGFDALYESAIQPLKGLAFLVPAGNDGKHVRMWPAAYSWVVSVGALSSNWQRRADFSNYGGWVDVYAPGEDLVNAFAHGQYRCNEPPNHGVIRTFHGMAKWSGTSFSTPLVAGLVAARMSDTGENGSQAAEALLRFARSQALPGVGAVLYPGQACCDPQRCRSNSGSAQAAPHHGCRGRGCGCGG